MNAIFQRDGSHGAKCEKIAIPEAAAPPLPAKPIAVIYKFILQ